MCMFSSRFFYLKCYLKLWGKLFQPSCRFQTVSKDNQSIDYGHVWVGCNLQVLETSPVVEVADLEF